MLNPEDAERGAHRPEDFEFDCDDIAKAAGAALMVVAASLIAFGAALYAFAHWLVASFAP